MYGLLLASDFPFAAPLPVCVSAPDLVFTNSSSIVPDLSDHNPVYVSMYRDQLGTPLLSLYKHQGVDYLRFHRVADFCISPSDATIVGQPCAGSDSAEIELQFLGVVLPYWLELAGIPVLHASAVSFQGQAVAFLGLSGCGKSTLAAALTASGFPLITDDVLPIEKKGERFLARPAYPQLRLWPDEAAHFLGGLENLRPVHDSISKRAVPVGPVQFGTFCAGMQEISTLYFLDRALDEDDPVQVVPVSPRLALMELIRCSFAARVVQALGIQKARMDFFTQLLRQVRVRRLSYPSRLSEISDVVEIVRQDLIRPD